MPIPTAFQPTTADLVLDKVLKRTSRRALNELYYYLVETRSKGVTNFLRVFDMTRYGDEIILVVGINAENRRVKPEQVLYWVDPIEPYKGG